MRLPDWWASLTIETRAAFIGGIVAAIVGPIIVVILGVPSRMVHWFHRRTLRKLKAAREQIGIEFQQNRSPLISEDQFVSPSLETLAKRAGISLWRAKAAIQYREEMRELGSY